MTKKAEKKMMKASAMQVRRNSTSLMDTSVLEMPNPPKFLMIEREKRLQYLDRFDNMRNKVGFTFNKIFNVYLFLPAFICPSNACYLKDFQPKLRSTFPNMATDPVVRQPYFRRVLELPTKGGLLINIINGMDDFDEEELDNFQLWAYEYKYVLCQLDKTQPKDTADAVYRYALVDSSETECTPFKFVGNLRGSPSGKSPQGSPARSVF